jgi:mRNA interferase HigB
MEIHNIAAIERFARKHADARVPLEEWKTKTEAANWNSLKEAKKTFKTADYKKPFVIFNIGGNNYRLLTEIIYPGRTITIINAGTHSEYEKWKL